jgi:alkylation response protein AidB-like acyl-CoA dehydrogenase
MELVLDEAQTILRESADKLVERHAGPARFRELRTTEHGFDPARLAVVAEAGWLSLLVPEERDGLGLGTTEAALVLESAGRGLMTEPIAAVMAAARAVASGPAAMGATLEGLTSGGSVILPALHDPAADDPAGARVQATPAGSGFKLSGRTGAVPGAPAADGFIVNARSGDGTVVCLVPRDAHGLEIQQRGRVDGTGHATLALNDVAVPADAVIASGAQGTEVAAATLDLVLLGTSAEMLGIMEQGLALAVDYLGTREQFGRPIGSFQALQHRAVNDHVDIELTRSLFYQVCAAMDDGRGNRAMVAAVKARASDAVLSVTKSMVQMHGAIGFTDEYNASLYLRRAMALSSQYGNAAWHRKRYARLSSRAA